jgi:CelD/BcsL family acetyltransferase involved in cellulose biosynthesis
MRRPEAAEIGVVDGLARLEALAGEWWTLWRADPRATPFQSPAWLLPWARRYAPDRSAAVAMRRDGELVAWLPLFVWQETLLLAGTGPSDYGDALVAADAANAATGTALLRALAAVADARGCAAIDLRQLRAGSPLLAGAAPRGWRDTLGDDLPCPCVALNEGELFAGASARWRRNLRHAERLLREADACTGRLDDAEIDVAATALQRLHRLRWSARGEDGVIDTALEDFLREAIPALHAVGLLRYQRIRIGERFVAAAFAMRGAASAHCYLSGFDPAWSQASPGMAVLAAAMRDAAAEGLQAFHLLRGRERYKYGFGARDRPTFRRRLERSAHAAATA